MNFNYFLIGLIFCLVMVGTVSAVSCVVDGLYTVCTFTGSETWNPPPMVTSGIANIGAGGGGGGAGGGMTGAPNFYHGTAGAGGGAGQLVTSSISIYTGMSIVVGMGGDQSTKGVNSSASGITAIGGNGGADGVTGGAGASHVCRKGGNGANGYMTGINGSNGCYFSIGGIGYGAGGGGGDGDFCAACDPGYSIPGWGGAGANGMVNITFLTLIYSVPTVTTQAVTAITGTTATGNGNIISIENQSPTIRGICYNTAGNPTTADSKVQETGTFGTGAFTENLVNLSKGTIYHTKAYAINANGTGYGAEQDFNTLYNPVASFNTNATGGISFISVKFNDTSTNTTSWKWGFKNLTPGNNTWTQFSTLQNPVYTFGIGNWSVNLTATNAVGNNISQQITWINITTNVGAATLYTNISDILVQQVIYYNGSFSLGDYFVYSWNWNFGDGGISTLKNPSHLYASYGTYNVTLTIVPNGGNINYSLSKMISIPQGTSYISNLKYYNQTNVTYLINDSVMTYGGIYSNITNITAIDIPELGGWVSVSAAGYPAIYNQQVISPTGFGSQYIGPANSGIGRDIAVSDSAAFSIEGRDLMADIYQLDGTRKGTYTTGGLVRSVDVAVKNGLWSVAGGDDGKVYIFSKDITSAWYVFYQGESNFPILSTAMSWRGEYAAAGRTDGILEYYSTNGTSIVAGSYMVNVFVTKGAVAYSNVNISILRGLSPSIGEPYVSGKTDSYGKFSFLATDLLYYNINVNSGEFLFDYQATSTYTTVTISIPAPLLTSPYNYASAFNETTNIITTTYSDVDFATVNITITDMSNNTIAHIGNYSHTKTVSDTYTSENTHEYRVNIEFTRITGHKYTDTIYVKSNIFNKIPGTPTQWVLFKYGAYCVFLMFVALAIGSTSPKFGVILIPSLVVLGVLLGFLPWSIWVAPLLLSAFIAMTEVLRRRND